MPVALDSWLQQQLGAAVRRRSSVAGGCIHSAWCLELDDGRRLFVKTNRIAALPWFDAEADGLQALAAVAPPELTVPEPLFCGSSADQAVLVLPWLDLGGSAVAESWQQLGRSLAQLHRRSLDVGAGQGRFGWGRDNVIGSNPQPNGWSSDWAAFFVEQRLGHQLRLAAGTGLRFDGSERLLRGAEAWLRTHAPQPVLVHGDLWSGNAALLVGGGATVFDPAVYRADREVDLAMARLFGGFPQAFFDGYAQAWPLPDDHRQRVELYNLYHLLNHANLFGGGYRQQAQQSIHALLGWID
jgi:fructosamine-3-kinase